MGITKHLFILNPKSFWNKWKWEQVLNKIHYFFDIAGQNNCALHISRFPRDAIGFIRSFARSIPKETTLRVYAVGGDGILFDCLNGIIGLDQAELAAVPYGHVNSFIRGFGKNAKTLFRKIDQQLTAPVIQLDVLRYGNNYALNSCLIGTASETVRKAKRIRGKMEKGRALGQWLSKRIYPYLFFMCGIVACWDKKLLFQKYTADIDGENFCDMYHSISIFNGTYCSGNIHPVNNAMPNDGVMEILFARSQGILRMSSLFPFYLTGRSGWFPGEFSLKRGRKIIVDSEDPLLIILDDVLFYDTQFTLELLPAAVRFVDASRHGYKGALADE